MPFDWTKYCGLADSLHAQAGTFTDSEACFRAAISRAYYSAFCSSRNYAKNKDGLELAGNARDHALVKDHFSNSTDRNRKKIGADLSRLRLSRNKADYNDTVNNLDNVSRVSLAQARGVLNKLPTL